MHPILFRVGDFPIYSYGLVLSIAFVVGVSFTIWLGRRRGYDPVFVSDMALWTLVLGLVGARLAFAAQNLPYYLEHPLRLLNFREGGISIQGGLLLGFSTTAWMFHRRGIPVQNGLDLAAAPVLLGMAIGRLGCVLHGCCFGKVCDPHWGIVYPASTNLGTLPRFPVQLYELGMDLVLMAAVLWMLGRVRFAGQAFWLMFGGYGVIRFVSEYFREGGTAGPLTPAQWLSLFFLALGVAGMAGLLGRPKVVQGEDVPAAVRATG